MSEEAIHVNIWDDYQEDGLVADAAEQETFAYVEGGNLNDHDKRAVLLQLQQSIESIKMPNSKLVCNIQWYDSATVYPNLVGTEHESSLFKRWQLQMKHLPHSEREHIVEVLSGYQLHFNDMSVVVYSES